MVCLAAVLRADAAIGTGHLMRVRTVLQELKRSGDFDCVLVTDSLAPELISQCGVFSKTFVVNGSGEYAEVCAQGQEVSRAAGDEALLETLARLQPDVTLIDNYSLGAEFESRAAAFGPVAVIDDLLRQHDCDLLVDPNLSRDSADPAFASCRGRVLAGAEYALVKPVFAGCAAHHAARARPRLLVNFGGADPAGACLTAALAAREAGLSAQMDITVLCGLSNPLYETIRKDFSGSPGFLVLRHCDDMPGLFSTCDFAVGAYGGTFPERVCAGLPAVNVVIADNQAEGPLALRRFGLGVDLPLERLGDPGALMAAVDDVRKNADVYRRNGMMLVDGRGPERVCAALCSLVS